MALQKSRSKRTREFYSLLYSLRELVIMHPGTSVYNLAPWTIFIFKTRLAGKELKISSRNMFFLGFPEATIFINFLEKLHVYHNLPRKLLAN